MTAKENDTLRFTTLLIGVLSACLFAIFLIKYAKLVTVGAPSVAIGGTIVAIAGTLGLYTNMATLQRLLRRQSTGLPEDVRLGLERIIIFLVMNGMFAIIALTTLCIVAGLNIEIFLRH